MDSAAVRTLRELQRRGGLTLSDIANICDTDLAFASQWKIGELSPPVVTQMLIARLCYVVERLSDFYSPDEIRRWLHSKHLLVNNKRAIDRIIADRTQEVLAVIERLDAGAYV